MSTPRQDKKTKEPDKSEEPKTLKELIEEVRPPELAKEIKAAVKKAVDGDNDGYPKLSRE